MLGSGLVLGLELGISRTLSTSRVTKMDRISGLRFFSWENDTRKTHQTPEFGIGDHDACLEQPQQFLE